MTIDDYQHNNFLQSVEWQTFQEAVGRRTARLNSESGELSVLQHGLPVVGSYIYLPKGPNSMDPVIVDAHINAAVYYAATQKAGWLRCEPLSEESLQVIHKSVRLRNVVKAPHDMQPRENFSITIQKDDDTLLGDMKSKTRYNIRLARKKDVRIARSQESDVVEAFLSLVDQTSERKGITAHPAKYYRTMTQTLPKDMWTIFYAIYNGQTIAANLVLFYKDSAVYLHGGTSDEHKNVMAPFLLQWETIRQAREDGKKWYDFGGIRHHTKKTSDDSAWDGITRFKMGFSPNTEPLVFPGAYDIVVSPVKYSMYRVLQKVKSWM